MWGEDVSHGKSNEMIDFLFCDEYFKWKENAVVRNLPIRNGDLIAPRLDGTQMVTCEGGIIDILRDELDYRHSTSPEFYKLMGPKIIGIGLKPENDFCSPEGREKLASLLSK